MNAVRRLLDRLRNWFTGGHYLYSLPSERGEGGRHRMGGGRRAIRA